MICKGNSQKPKKISSKPMINSIKKVKSIGKTMKHGKNKSLTDNRLYKRETNKYKK